MTDNLPENTDSSAVATYQSEEIVSAASGETEVKDFDVVDESHPVARATGSTKARKRQVDDDWLNEILAEQIYDESSAFAREFLQNSETACIRKARMMLAQHPDYGAEFLTRELWYDPTTDTDITEVNDKPRQKILAEYTVGDEDLVKVSRPQKLERVVEAARDIGYDPTITIDLYRDERKLIWEDNGIGMTFNELDGAYNFTGRSGSGIEGDTGGKWGMGALTFANVSGKDGDIIIETKTCREGVPSYNHDGIRVCAYVGGYNPLPNNIDDDFQGTRFEMPILKHDKGGVKTSNIQDWVKQYTDKLKVPVIYREHRNGETLIEEEYGGVKFHEEFNDPPVVIDRPGEFTAVTGPEVKVGRMSLSRSQPDTWLVSMPIRRNTPANVESFWNVAIQIHDEQGRIIAGPHRGQYRANVEQNGGLHEEDVILPEPTADRDRLSKDSHQKKFFRYVSSKVQDAELALVDDFTHKIDEADYAAEAIMENSDDWHVFAKMVNYHGKKATRNLYNFTKFVGERNQFADWDDDTIKQVCGMFEEVQHAPSDCYQPRLKKHRSKTKLGNILADSPRDHVFVGCTINENKHAVVHNTFDDASVIACERTSEYSTYQETYGFHLLNDVPLTQGDHRFEVPDKINKAHTRDAPSSDEGGGSAEIEAVGARTLSIRCNNSNTKIDQRLTIEDTLEKLDERGRIGGHDTLVVFPRGGEYNISDFHWMQKFAAIASVTAREYETIGSHPRVKTYDEFYADSKATVVATEEGGYRVDELMDLDRHIILCHANEPSKKLLLKEENATLRGYYIEDMHDQPRWNPDDDGNENKDEPLFAVADDRTLNRAKLVFYRQCNPVEDILGLKWDSYGPQHNTGIRWKKLNGSAKKYKLKAQTPKWEDNSEVYDLFRSYRQDDFRGSVLMGMHDAGFDPTKVDNETVRNLVATIEEN